MPETQSPAPTKYSHAGGDGMWGASVEFWSRVADWTLLAAFILGGLTVIASFASSLIASRVTARVQAFAATETQRVSAATQGAAASAATANERAAAANERAAQLEKEAAEARLETERIKQHLAWRELTPAQMTELTRSLSAQPLTLTFAAANDPEALSLGNQVLLAFHLAGLNIIGTSRRIDAPVLTADVLVSGRGADIARMRAALEAVGLSVATQLKDQDLEVLVGSKPRPVGAL